MRRPNLLLTTCLLAVSLAALAAARPKDKSAAAPSVTGTWKCVAHGVAHNGQSGDTPFTLDLQQEGEDVTGSVTSPLGDADLSAAKFKDPNLQIEIDTENEPYILTATLEHGELKGEWSHGQAKGAWEGKKAAPAAESPSQPQ